MPSAKSKKRKDQATMGLDLSLAGTGLVVWDGKKVIYHTLLRTEPYPPTSKAQTPGLRPSGSYRGNQEERIEWQRRKIKKAIMKFKPKLVLLEKEVFAKNSRSLSPLYEQAGVIKNLMHRLGVPFDVVHNATLKKEATGNGKATKMEMIYAAKEVWPEVHNDNEADACHLAIMAMDRYDEIVSPL